MSAGLWVLVGIVGFLLLLLLLPIRLRVSYGEMLTVWGGLGPLLFRVIPPKEKKKKAAPKKPKASKKKKKGKIPAEPPGPLTLDKLMEWLEFGKSALKNLKGLMRVRYFHLHAMIGGEDPAAVALAYGGAAAAISSLYPIVEACFRVRSTDISIDADFGGKGSLLLEAEIRMTPLVMLIAGIKIARQFLTMHKRLNQNQTATREVES